MSKKISIWMLIAIMTLSMFNFLHWSEKKEGFHCDEVYSYGLSNYQKSFQYTVYDEDNNIRWNTDKEIDEYLIVSEKGRFDYKTVFSNQKNDVHPPFFYMIIHTLSSLFPDSYSKYIGIIPNIIFTLGTCIFLYFIAMNILKKRSLALLSVLCFAFSVNCVNMVTYVRMYAELTFFTTAVIYLHIRFIKNNCTFTKTLAAAMFFVVFLGAYTQYYFLIFLVGAALFTGFSMLFKKEYKKLLIYVGVMAFAGIVYLLVWPAAISHVFSSSRGVEAFDNASNASLFKNMWNYAWIFDAGIGTSLLFVLIVSLILNIILKKREINFKYLKKNSLLFMIAFVSLFYFVLIAKVAPYQTDRYIAPIFPLIIVMLIYSANIACKSIYERFNPDCKYVTVILITAVVVGLALNTKRNLYDFDASVNGHNYLYRISDEYRNFAEENKDKKCVMINTHEAHFLFNLQDYKNYEETAFVNEAEMDKLLENNHLENEDEFVLYINYGMDGEAVADKVTKLLGFDSYELAVNSWNRHWANIYRVYRK